MDIDKLTNKTIDEMLKFMKTEEFKSKVDKDDTAAFVIEYSRILLSNYHNELSSKLKAHDIEI